MNGQSPDTDGILTWTKTILTAAIKTISDIPHRRSLGVAMALDIALEVQPCDIALLLLLAR